MTLPDWIRYFVRDGSLGVPDLPGVYIFASRSRVLYVGRSINLRQRLKSHPMIKHDQGDLFVLWEVIPINKVREAERRWIAELKPIHNTQPVGQSEWGGWHPAPAVRQSNRYTASFQALRSMIQNSHKISLEREADQ